MTKTAQAATEYCKRCDRKLNPSKIVWLEMSLSHKYAVEDVIPSAESQGFFSFGQCCAGRMLTVAPYPIFRD